MFQSPGLRFAIFGLLLFLAGAASMLALPYLVGIVAMMLGGLAVWSGFVWTMLEYYGQGTEGSGNQD
jgi:hypothetical protein